MKEENDAIRRQRLMEKTKRGRRGECWLWQGGKSSNGYGITWAYGLNILAHRLSYLLHVGPLKAGMVIMHSCDTPLCVNPGHLKQGTHADNVADAVKKGRARGGSSPGTKNPNHKLNNSDIRAIRRMHKNGESQSSIGALHGVSQATISRILHRQGWTHL